MPLPAFQPQNYGGAIDPSTSSTMLQVGGGNQAAVQNFGRFQAGIVDAQNDSQRSLVAGTANLGESMARMGEFIFAVQEKKHVEDEAMWLAPLKAFTSSQGLERLAKGDQQGWNFLSAASGIGAGNPILARMNDSIMDAGKAANETFVTTALQTQKQLFDAHQAELDRANAVERTQIAADASMANTQTRVDASGGNGGTPTADDSVNTFMRLRAGGQAPPPIVNDNQPSAGEVPAPGTDVLPDPGTANVDAPTDLLPGEDPNAPGGQGAENDETTPVEPPADASLNDILAKKDWKLPELETALNKQPGVKTLPLSSTMVNAAGGVLALTGDDSLPPISLSRPASGGIALSTKTGEISDAQKAKIAGASKVLDGLDDFGSSPTFSNEFPKYGGTYQGIKDGTITYEPIQTGQSAADSKVQFYGQNPQGFKVPIGKPVDKSYIESAEKIKSGYDAVRMAGGDIAFIPVGKGKGQQDIPVVPDAMIPYMDQLNGITSQFGPDGKPLFTAPQALKLMEANMKPTKSGSATVVAPDLDALDAAIKDKYNSLKNPDSKKNEAIQTQIKAIDQAIEYRKTAEPIRGGNEPSLDGLISIFKGGQWIGKKILEGGKSVVEYAKTLHPKSIDELEAEKAALQKQL